MHNTFECANPGDKVTGAELYLIQSSFLQMEIGIDLSSIFEYCGNVLSDFDFTLSLWKT